MENVEIARLLNEYPDLLDIKGGNAFRVRSYRKAAQAVEGLFRPLGLFHRIEGVQHSGPQARRRTWLENQRVRRLPHAPREEVFHAAKEHDVALELNAQPRRLDLRDVHVPRAKELGVKVAINSDAHSTDQLHFMRYGIDQSRRGWLEKDDVVNMSALNQLRAWLGRKRT